MPFHALLSVCQRTSTGPRIAQKAKGSFCMVRGATRTGRRQQCLSWGVLLFLIAYFLNLCTVSPRVHAASVGRSSSDQQASAEHCAQSHRVAQPPAPGAANHEQREDPFCCALRSENNKTVPSFLIRADFLPVVEHLFLPSSTALVSGCVQSLYSLHALHSSHPPPLYLIHAVLLI